MVMNILILNKLIMKFINIIKWFLKARKMAQYVKALAIAKPNDMKTSSILLNVAAYIFIQHSEERQVSSRPRLQSVFPGDTETTYQ